MEFRLSRHAEWEMARRSIPLALVQTVMDAAEQRLRDESRAGAWIYQSRLRFEDGENVFVAGKIEKYWSAE